MVDGEPLSKASPTWAESLLSSLEAPIVDPLDDLGRTATLLAQSMAWLVRPPVRGRQLFAAVEFIGAGSLFITVLVGMFTGMAFTLSSIVGFRQFRAEGMVGGVVALALARELAPVLAAVVVTARAGSTMASELGNMRVTEQIDAITTMGVSPIQFLVTPRIVATVLVLPPLALVFGIAGMMGSFLVAVVWQGIDPGVFQSRIDELLTTSDIRMLLTKSAVFGVIVSAICCKQGFYATGGARGVGAATARAVVSSIVTIFVADYVTTALLT